MVGHKAAPKAVVKLPPQPVIAKRPQKTVASPRKEAKPTPRKHAVPTLEEVNEIIKARPLEGGRRPGLFRNALRGSFRGAFAPALEVGRTLTPLQWDTALPPLLQGIKGIVPVYFQTNRKIIDGTPFSLAHVTSERSLSSSFGVVDVSIPVAHRMGAIERPGYTWLGTKQKQNVAEHFTIYSLSKLSQQQFVTAMANPEKSLMLFVHGYNVSFTDAAFSAAQLAFDAKYKGRVVMFSWPSKGGLFDYDYDRESAVFSSDALFELLKTIKQSTDISRIIVVAHSLGSEIVIGTLHQATLSATKLGITELIFAASDVSRDLYLQRGKHIREAADHVTLYASSTDRALLASLVKAQSGTRMGYVLKDGPTLVEGIETIDVSAVGEDMFALNHSTYAKSRAVVDDIGRLLFRSDHPPHTRTVTFELKPDENNPKYWRYPD
jgi:esterase/lipase superfamily enzyme